MTDRALCIWQRNDNLSIMVPDHPPKVLYGVGQGSLCDDEFTALMVTLQTEHTLKLIAILNTLTTMKEPSGTSSHHDIRSINVI